MALGGFTDAISEGGITEIVTVSSLSSALNFALGTTEGNVMRFPPLLLMHICVIVFEKFGMKYPGH